MGKRWHDDGRVLNKNNVFLDFIACAEHLIAQGLTTPELLCIKVRPVMCSCSSRHGANAQPASFLTLPCMSLQTRHRFKPTQKRQMPCISALDGLAQACSVAARF